MSSRWHTPALAWPRGQVLDLVRSLPTGQGRLHYQEWPGGRGETHRDRFDPERGPAQAVLHVLLETPILVILAALGALGFAGYGVVRYLRGAR